MFDSLLVNLGFTDFSDVLDETSLHHLSDLYSFMNEDVHPFTQRTSAELAVPSVWPQTEAGPSDQTDLDHCCTRKDE